MQRLPGLDAVRALAIVLVMVAHGALLAAPAIGNTLRTGLLYLGGYFGVELFFALSGLLIVGGLLRRLEKRPVLAWHDIWHFWQRRWWRTLPNYFVFLLLNATLFAAMFNTPVPDIRYAVFWQNLAWPHPAAMPEAWSLAVEEWFYLLLPLLLAASLALLPAPRRAVPALLVGWVAAGTLGRFAVAFWADPAWDESLRKVALLRLDAIAWGGLAACWLHYLPGLARRTAKALFHFGAAGMGICIAWLLAGVGSEFQPVPAYTGIFTLTGASAALCLPRAALWQPRRPALVLPVTWLSLISYSLYLVHFSFALPLMQLPLLADSVPLAWRLVGYVVLSLALAWGAYRLVECPALALRNRIAPASGRSAKGA